MMKEIQSKLQNTKSFTYMAFIVLKSKLFSASISLLSSIIIIRALPKDEWGLYILTLTFFAIFEIFLSGTDASLTRFIPTSGKKKQHQLVATVLSIKTILTILFLFLFIFLYDISINLLNIPVNNISIFQNLYLIISIGFISKYILTTVLVLLNAYLLYDFIFRLTILNSIATLLIALLVSHLGLNIWQFAILTTFFSYIYAIVSFYTFFNRGKLSYRLLFKSINIKTFKYTFTNQISSYSLPLFGVGLMSYIKNYLPSFILGTAVSLESLAVFNIFKRLTDFLHKGQASFIQGLYPRLFKMVSEENKTVVKLYFLGFAIRFFVFLTLYFGYEIVLDVYDINQTKYTYLIFLMLISVFLTMYFATFFNLIIQSKVSTFTILKTSIFRSSLFIALVPLGYAYYGLLGLISSIFIAELGLALLLIILVNKNYLFKKMLYSYFCLLAMYLYIALRDSTIIFDLN